MGKINKILIAMLSVIVIILVIVIALYFWMQNATNHKFNEITLRLEEQAKQIQELSSKMQTNTKESKPEMRKMIESLNETQMAELKAKIENDEADYGNDYLKFTYDVYTRKPDRIVFKQGNRNGFAIYEKTDENYEHLLEVSEDRMAYSVMQDFNLYCFTPDSIQTMMNSGDNYIIFDYDNDDLAENENDFQKDIIFRFTQNTRLYRLASYLSYQREQVAPENLGKSEFANNTSISGYKYMIQNELED